MKAASVSRTHTRGPGHQPWWTRLAFLCLLAALLGCLAASRTNAQGRAAAPKQQKIDLQITVMSLDPTDSRMAVTYPLGSKDPQIKQDFAELARKLGVRPPQVRITREDGLVTGEAALPGLTNWSAGTVNIDPLISTFRKYGHFNALWMLGTGFPPQAPESITRPPLRIEKRANPGTVSYEIWLDQSQGVPQTVPSATTVSRTRSSRPEIGWPLILALSALTALVVGGVYLIVHIILTQRRTSAAGGEKS